jgi:hypothetical protein
MTPTTIKTIAKLRADGIPDKQIAESLNMTRPQLAWIVKKHGLPTKRKADHTSTNKIIRQRYLAGDMIKDIAADFGMHKSTIGSRIKAMGLPSRCPRAETSTAPATRHVEPVAIPDTIEGRILATKGRYSALAQIADDEGLPLGTVMFRWHRVRTGLEYRG